MTRTLRRAAVVALTLVGLATVQPAAATPAPDPLPTFDFADCPTIPEAADPARWRCEVLMSTGTVRFGALAEQPTGAMRLTFAEGYLDDKFAQVFGALRAEPVRVPGGLLGVPGSDVGNPLLRMETRIEYAGFADFLTIGDQMGEQHLKIRVISRLLPATCTIGVDQDPIRFRPIRTSGPDEVSADPPVLRFTIEDTRFAVPRVYGCGGFDRLVSWRFGLPAAAGANAMTLTTLVGLKSYPLT